MCNVDDVWLETTSLLFTPQEVVAGNTHTGKQRGLASD